ncbi:hypothetical protein SLEP1_g41044 [Rubroshorea leprosula]|uniref:DUF4283 domain-containing protein n=1 Tax=Rubroshorea leprosula TaxID=152421 RepID=A0AAV5L5M9_9ROSI|nr:hypothetical protein SLEP1_g41044 [Rubroshorea leprosula]
MREKPREKRPFLLCNLLHRPTTKAPLSLENSDQPEWQLVRERTYHNLKPYYQKRDCTGACYEGKRDGTIQGKVEWFRGGRGGLDKGLLKQTTYFFITNFPEEWRYEDMWKEFKKYEMELNLSKIKLGERRLQANLAMYNEESGALGMKKRESKTNASPTKQVEGIDGMKSYVDAVRSNVGAPEGNGLSGKRWTPKKNNKVNEEMSELENVWECHPSAKNKEWLKNYFVGDVEGEIMNLIKKGSGWIGERLKDIRTWSLKEVAKERYTWLQCYGVPLNIWNEEFFKRVKNRYGKAIEVDQPTILKKSRICEETWTENAYSPSFLSKKEGESSDELWVQESSLGESDSEWKDREFVEDSLQISTRKVSMKGDNQTVGEEGCSPVGNFEIPLEVARKATVTNGTDGEVEIASNRHIRKECTNPKGYKKEVEVLKELRVEEEEKETMSDFERASSNKPQKVHF